MKKRRPQSREKQRRESIPFTQQTRGFSPREEGHTGKKLGKRRRKKKQKLSGLVILVILIIFIYLVYTYVYQSIRLSKLRQEKEHLEQVKVSLEQEVESLEIDYSMRGTPGFMEKMAREKFGMIKSNEQIYVDINHSPNAPE